MTSRERVVAAISHKAPDTVPIGLNLTFRAYENLKRHLGIDADEQRAPNSAMEVVPGPSMLETLGVDIISLRLGVPRYCDSLPEFMTDAWGLKHQLIRQSVGECYEVVSHPLANATPADLESYPWPELRPIEKIAGLEEYARHLYETTDLALMGRFGGPILETAAHLLGAEEWYVRLALNKEFISALLDKISAVCTAHDILGLETVGKYLQIVKVSGEDFGMQTGPLYSMEIFRDVLLPPLRRRWAAVRDKLSTVNPNAKIMLHSCGCVSPFIQNLIEAGIDILDPVQPLAEGMGAARLRSDFGGRIAFHGGVDIQKLLPTGSPEEVVASVCKCLADFKADCGGLIIAPSHNVQADVPPENIIAMVQAVRSWRTGPIDSVKP